MNLDLQKALRVATVAARSSGQILLQKYKKIDIVKQKNADMQDFVTEADLASERNIKRIISKKFPHHSILAEESGLKKQKSEYLWAIDPLCGTANFINHIDLFNISIGLVWKKQPILGVVYDPIRKELYCAIIDRGAYFNGERAKVSGIRGLNRATIAFTLGKTKKKRSKWPSRIGKLITSSYKLREFGSTPLSIGLLITGRVDAYIALPEAWDAAASIVLTREADGRVTDWQGKKWGLKSDSLIASNGKIHQQLVEILKER